MHGGTDSVLLAGGGARPAVAFSGGTLLGEDTTPVNVGLAARALRHGWSVPNREALLAEMAAIATDRNRKPRERVAAFRAIVAAEKLDLDAVKTAIASETHETIRTELEALRLEIEGKPPLN